MQFSPVIFSILAAALSLSIARALAQRLLLLDKPSTRKQHLGAVPMVGGVSIFVGGWMGITVVAGVIPESLWPFFFASLLITAVGVQDDRVDLSVKPRFLVELIAVGLLAVWGSAALNNLGDLFGWGAVKLGWLSFPFTLFAVVGVINALNMVDGIDGLAGTLSLIALVVMGGLAWDAGRVTEVWVVLLFGAAMLPYLLCNLRFCGNSSRVFLGDAGSMLLG